MRDRSKQLLVINTGKKQSEQTGMTSQSSTTHIIGGGGLSVNMSDYLLKSTWEKVFEIRTDSQGTEYIFGKLPVVTQYGITMYSGGNVDVPSLASGLPFDGRTIWYNSDTQQIEVIGGTGGGSGEGVSNFWDLSGIPSWITNSKPKYTYTEIEGTPDLSGYATESWVLGKSYITSATLGTELGKYVTLDTDQSLKGKKDFKNGLSIDGLELRKSQDDVVYIDANLVVRGGVTMYAQNEVEIPSIIDSIPTASTTVKGIASFDGAYFSVVNGKVSLIASNVGLNEEELYNYLTSNNYAKKSDIPSLVGYATQSWVENKKYLTAITSSMVTSALGFTPYNSTNFTKANIKSTLGISDWALAAFKPSYTTSEVSEGTNLYFTNARAVSALTETLKAYVTLGGTQTITGEKNFTGGLKVNGSPIYYDSTKKYWKLEGDLLVTGGVTMYGNEGTFTPSTIMDAIAVDGTTISKEGGVLKVIGGTGGGVADSVAWANITGKPTWIGSSKPSYSYSEITGAISATELQNYLTQNSYLNVTSGDNRYLKLSGGTISGGGGNYTPLIVEAQSLPEVWLQFKDTVGNTYIGSDKGQPAVYIEGDRNYLLLHSGNYSNYALPLSGGTINSTFGGLEIKRNNAYASAIKYSNTSGVLGYIGFNDNLNPMLWNKSRGELGVIIHSGNIGSYNAGSATKLQTARTIWGQSFDGTGNVSGNLTLENNYEIVTKNTSGSISSTLYRTKSNNLSIGEGIAKESNDTYISGNNLFLRYGTGLTNGISLTSSGNVGIGVTSPSYTLDVSGTCRASTSVTSNMFFTNGEYGIWKGSSFTGGLSANDLVYYAEKNVFYGNVGIGTTNPNSKLDINGSLKINEFIDIREPNTKNRITNYVYNGIGRIYGYNDDSGYTNLYLGRNDSLALVIKSDGTVGIGTENPSAKVHIVNNTNTLTGLLLDGGWSGHGFLYNGISILLNGEDYGGIGVNTVSSAYGSTAAAGTYITNAKSGEYMNFYNEGGTFLKSSLLVNGGITMYSDQRKKTILNHVELSLKQIANAPLIEHYYNSDEKKTTHVGSVAQYWASMNDWFCKLDSEGFYTMEIQNAALASAISIARELDRYETKTDKAIKKLKKRIFELEEEVERLKAS